MRINFKTIEIHNFMSFEDEVFDFNSHLGMNLICGKNNDIKGSKNGTGKSTLFSALCFALFGETQNKIKNENVHNRYLEEKDVRVVIYFDVDQTSFKIASGLNKHNQAFCNLWKIDPNTEEEVDLTKSSILETRRFIEKEILHFDMPIFLRTIFLSSDQNYNFYRLRKFEKKDFIEKLFDISVFGSMYNAIHRDTLTYDKSITSTQNRLMVLNRTGDEYTAQIDKYNKSHQEQMDSLKNSLDKLESEYKALKSTNVKNNSEEVAKYEDAYNKVNERIVQLNSNINECKSKSHKIDLAIHKLQTSKETKQKLIDKHAEILNKLCDDCSKLFKDYYSIDQISDDIKLINEKIESLETNKTDLDATTKTYNERTTALTDKLNKIQIKIDDLSEEYNKMKQQLLVLETRIDNFNTQYEAKKSAKNPYIELFDNNKKQIEKEMKDLEEMSDKYKYLKFAENIVSQDTLRKFIINDLIGLLNNKIKTYLTKLGAKYEVIFDSDMNYEFITEGGKCEYDSFSSGEKMRITLATAFAFRDFLATRSSLTSNILVLDEYIDSNIDSLAIDGIINILKDYIILYKQNIFLISHRKEIDNSIFNNIIQVQKTNNISKIVVLEN